MTRPYTNADERRRQALALLRDGITIAELRDGMGYASNENATRVMETLVYAGQAFSARSKCIDDESPHPWTTFYFTTAEARDAFLKAKDEAIKARIKARKKATAKRMPYYVKRTSERAATRDEQEKARAEKLAAERAQREAMKLAEREQRKERQRLDREAKAAEKQREKAEAKKLKTRLKAETKAAGRLVFKGGTDSPKPKKPAFADLPVVNPNGVKPVVIESKLRDRFAVDGKVPSVISSRECRPWAEVAAA